MKLTEHIHLIGSGRLGFNLTDELDCHVFLVATEQDAVIIDAGAGRTLQATQMILAEIARDGIDPAKISRLLLTHTHADHAGGAHALSEQLGIPVLASTTAAGYLRRGDEHAISLDRARLAGGYPADYTYHACQVATELADAGDDRIAVGDLELRSVATPGHCGGHLSFALHHPGDASRPSQIDLFAGDAVFAGGRILLQDIWDCSVTESCRSVERLAQIRPNGFFPAHGAFSIDRGWTHLDQAMTSIAGLLPPPQFG